MKPITIFEDGVRNIKEYPYEIMNELIITDKSFLSCQNTIYQNVVYYIIRCLSTCLIQRVDISGIEEYNYKKIVIKDINRISCNISINEYKELYRRIKHLKVRHLKPTLTDFYCCINECNYYLRQSL